MQKQVKKAIVIGVDAAVPDLVEKFCSEGKLPNFSRLIQEGVFAPECLVPFPTITPPNWTTIATGAMPGTHGITCFTVHHPGDPLDKIYTGFNSRECSAEYLWEAAERAGKKSILIKYPASWPPTVKEGIHIDGCHPHECIHEIDVPHLFATESYPLSTLVELTPAQGWTNLPRSLRTPFETQVSIQAIIKREIIGRLIKDEYSDKPLKLNVVVIASGDGGYDTVIISKTKDASKPIVILKEGEWSDWIVEEFQANERSLKGAFKLKLLRLSPDGEEFALYSSHVTPYEGFAFPDGISQELIEKVGPFPIDAGWFGITRGWFDAETFLELTEWQNQWYANAAKYLTQNKDWDLLFMQTHCLDFIKHVVFSKADPLTARDPEESKENMAILEETYASVDRMLGEVLKCAGDDTLVFVVSDHGVTTHIADIPIQKVLRDAGLLVFKEDPDTGLEVVDWSRTKAFPQRSVYIYVNLKGRDPYGIVEPGAEYEEVRDKIIEALCNYREPKTGKRMIALALKREDAPILGLRGDRIGDVVYAVNAEFGHEHGQKLPTGKYGIGSMHALFLISGPNIKKGLRYEGPIHLTDIAPTIAYMMDIPMPRDAEGSILFRFMEDPDFKIKEKERLERELLRWKTAYEKQLSVAHNRTF